MDVTSDTRWTTSDSSILTVSDTGLVTAIGYGIAEVRAVYGAYSAAISVTVSLPAATALAIRGGGAPIRGINQTLQLRADVTLADGTVLDGTTSSTWRSSNSSVAVVRSDGLVTSVGFGTTQISVDYQRLTASILITVVAATVTFTAISEGGNTSRPFDLGGVAFQRDGRTFYSGTGGGGGGRGINIAAIDGRSGGLMGRAMNFDTWATRASGSGMVALIEFINRQPNGTLLLVAVGDEGGLTQDSPDCLPNPTRDSICCRPLGYSWTENGLRTLEALGARQIRQYCYRNSYALIAVKGEGAKAEALANGRQVTVQHALMVR